MKTESPQTAALNLIQRALTPLAKTAPVDRYKLLHPYWVVHKQGKCLPCIGLLGPSHGFKSGLATGTIHSWQISFCFWFWFCQKENFLQDNRLLQWGRSPFQQKPALTQCCEKPQAQSVGNGWLLLWAPRQKRGQTTRCHVLSGGQSYTETNTSRSDGGPDYSEDLATLGYRAVLVRLLTSLLHDEDSGK